MEPDEILKLLRKVPDNSKFFFMKKVSHATTINAEEIVNDDCQSLINLIDETNPTTSNNEIVKNIFLTSRSLEIKNLYFVSRIHI